MIEQSLVYVHSTKPPRRFVGCGTLVEGGYVATCRHVWRLATAEQNADVELEVEIEYPRAYQEGVAKRTRARLADNCERAAGPAPELVLLLPNDIPPEAMTLQLAREDKFESGTGYALIGLAGRDRSNPTIPEDVRIDAKIANHRNARGLRQFTGINDTSYWSGRGSSGSPVFLEQGQQLAGILSKSELGANAGDSTLREAFVVPATTTRPYLVNLIAQQTAKTQHIPIDSLQPILEMVGAQDISIAEIPDRIRRFVEAARAHAAEPVHPSNDGADIEAVIGASREKLGQLDTAGARAVLQAKIDEEEKARTRRLIPLLNERAAIERLAFDHESAKASLAEIIRLARDDVWAHIHLGDLWRITGNLDNAAEAYRGAEQAARRTSNERDLSVSHNRIGDVLLSQGDRDGALAAYRAALAIAETLARRDPANTEWQRDRSVSHDRIGDVLFSQGDRDGALTAYRAALAIRETLARRDPANTEWQRDLSVSHDKIGDVLRSQGDRDGALTAYRAALAIAETLARRDLANTEWQRDLSVSHNRIGDVLFSQGDRDGALTAYRTALAVRETLTRRDPANTQWQRDLIVSYVKMAEAEPTAARAQLSRALDIARTLQSEGRLAPTDAWVIDDLTQRLGGTKE
jgi:predicted negative regulator of RcsB-dependent stress response